MSKRSIKKAQDAIKNSNKISIGNLYEINKNLMTRQEGLNNVSLEEKRPSLEDWFNNKIDGYAILLCRERYDFTFFHLYEKENPNPPKVAVTELFETLKNRGTILSIEKKDNFQSEQAWEIWLKIDDEPYLYFLFGCDEWTIEC